MSLLHSKHEKYFNRCLVALPSQASSEDSNKLAIIYFCLQGLIILNKFNFSKEECKYHENFIWSDFYFEDDEIASFRSTSYFKDLGRYDFGNLSACFFAIVSLISLGSDLKRLNREKLMKYLGKCQTKEGGFIPSKFGEPDLRQCYMALLIRQIINNDVNTNNDIDLKSLEAFILERLNFNGGFSSTILDESHLGYTFCAIASLKMLNYPLDKLKNTRNWLLHRQADSDGGFDGRENKLTDTCYSWWCTGSLALLGDENLKLFNHEKAESYLLEKTQNSVVGGFSSRPDATPDPLHSFLALASLSLWNHKKFQLNEINPLYVICKKNIN
ncbi:CDC43 [Candida pseudojiufengensis]|uniref:CDC43 n=1 Tax=Candida pseudojiufengensis TaxID=497109 RepID=UPI00222444AE|nr:CDC43 [Candida pseudojiufengensis]KAI5962388.1 CDC43 [Candida pseudojiufengensis]